MEERNIKEEPENMIKDRIIEQAEKKLEIGRTEAHKQNAMIDMKNILAVVAKNQKVLDIYGDNHPNLKEREGLFLQSLLSLSAEQAVAFEVAVKAVEKELKLPREQILSLAEPILESLVFGGK